MSKNRKRSIQKNTELDIALLTCGLVDIEIFKKCVEAIIREAGTIESRVYVYLNGAEKSSEKEFKEVIETIPGVTLKQTSERVGFPVAGNRTIKMGIAPLVLFITDDVILHPGSVMKLVERMRSNPQIGLCGMKLVFPADSTDPARPAGRVQHIGHGIDIRGEVTHPLIGWTPENPKCCISREVLSVTGGVFIVLRNAFHKAGGFFDGYGMGYYEDVDLNLSIREQGYIIWVETDAVADHYTNQSMMKAKLLPMNENKVLFRARKGHLLVNDSFTFWSPNMK